MKIAVIPGYGDRSDYLRYLTKSWARRFGDDAEIITFGWSGEAGSFDDKDRVFMECINAMGEVALVGISAGASAALRAKHAFPDLVRKVVTICGPVNQGLMDREKLHKDYPLLERSLQELDLQSITTENVMTLRPLYDEVVPVKAMHIPGATDVRMRMVTHMLSIPWGIYHHADDINSFLRQ